MTTNREWLFSKPWDEQLAWLNAEHVEPNVNDGGTNGIDGGSPLVGGTDMSRIEAGEISMAALAERFEVVELNGGDAVKRLRDIATKPLPRVDAPEADMCGCLSEIADMVERDYVRRDAVQDVIKGQDRTIENAEKYIKSLQDAIAAKLEVGAAAKWKRRYDECDQAYRELQAERDELKSNNGELHRLAGEQADKIDNLERERDEWKAIAKAHEMALDNLGQIADMSEKEPNRVHEGAEVSEADTREYRECDDAEFVVPLGDAAKFATDPLNAQVIELTGERDEWRKAAGNTRSERETYRRLFGKCLDYADAIISLMSEVDDEAVH